MSKSHMIQKPYLREDVLAPIPGDNPSGADLRYSKTLRIYSDIREAQRQDVDSGKADPKMADFPRVIEIAQNALATVSKDLTLAGWLTEALFKVHGASGLMEGLELCHDLLVNFWDTIYPPITDGDHELRASPLAAIGKRLDVSVRMMRITSAGDSWITYKDSRKVGYKSAATTYEQQNARKVMIDDEGKKAPEDVDKAVADTPKSDYVKWERDLDGCIQALKVLKVYCVEKFGEDAPPFDTFAKTLAEVRQTVHILLEKKRETEPDPFVKPPVEQLDPPESTSEEHPDVTSGNPIHILGDPSSAEPGDRRQAVASIVAAAAFLRKREPFSPVPYLLLRGLRWGELRTAVPLAESPLLEAPSTDLRRQIKRLALAKRWAELLEAGEQAFALPGSRAWLDLQRLTVAACTALGPDYRPIASAIQSELRALLNDIPELLDATLLDDTSAANPETKAWLKTLNTSAVASQTVFGDILAAPETVADLEVSETPSWLACSVDAYALAQDAMVKGRGERAFAIMRIEIGRQQTGRRRFRRTMQMIDLAISAGKTEIAQPLLDDVAAMIETHKLDSWEDPEQVASDLLKVMLHSTTIQGNPGEKKKLFERICRLDPVRALSAV